MERRLAAILSADVVGYSRLMGENETRTLSALKAHRKELIEPKEAQYHGRTIKLMGDGALMEFGSVVDAVQFAVEFQLAMQQRNADVSADQQIVYRVGINVGDVIVEEDDIYGDGVNVAARLEALADPGGICVRRNVRNQVRDKLDIDFDDLGEVEVKNINRPIRVFRVVLNDKADRLVTPIVAEPTAKANVRWPVIVSLLVFGIIAASGLVYWQLRTPAPDHEPQQGLALPLPDKPSIAVLPFANLSGDPDQDFFADGLTTDLITDLSNISELFVIARNSVFTYKGKAVKIQQVAKDLGVRYVLEGTVRRTGAQIRINAQLIDAATGHHIWAERYDRSQKDIFAVQDEVMGKIISALAVQLTDREERQLARIPTSNLEAYDNYLRAEQSAYSGDVAKIRQAIKQYRLAIRLDPAFAQAHAGLARTFADVLLYQFGNLVIGPVAREAAFKSASMAAKLDPELARPLSVLSIVQMIDGEHANAINSARKAVVLAPNDAEAHINLAFVLGAAGELDAAVTEIGATLRLNPKPPPGFLITAGLTYYLHRDYERAVSHLEQASKIFPDSVVAREYLIIGYAQTGRIGEAKDLLKSFLVEFDAGYSRSAAQIYYGHYKRHKDQMHILDGLQKAGLPRWPFGFSGADRDRLKGEEIEKITNGATWTGRFLKAEPFFLSFDQNGSFALRTQNTIRAGSSKILQDELCLKSPSQYLGRWMCGPVFRNPDGSTTNQNAYVHGAGNWHFEFGLAR